MSVWPAVSGSALVWRACAGRAHPVGAKSACSPGLDVGVEQRRTGLPQLAPMSG
jgi:hypothetical protein